MTEEEFSEDKEELSICSGRSADLHLKGKDDLEREDRRVVSESACTVSLSVLQSEFCEPLSKPSNFCVCSEESVLLVRNTDEEESNEAGGNEGEGVMMSAGLFEQPMEKTKGEEGEEAAEKPAIVGGETMRD